MFRRSLPAGAAALVTAALCLGEQAVAARGEASRSPVIARHGLVCAAQPLAVQAGLDILKAGGCAAQTRP